MVVKDTKPMPGDRDPLPHFAGRTDELAKQASSRIPCPTFEATAFTAPKPLSEAKVALVTSASLDWETLEALRP